MQASSLQIIVILAEFIKSYAKDYSGILLVLQQLWNNVYLVKVVTPLIAILLSLPFLDCICDNSPNLHVECSHCDNDRSFPISDHDCLDVVEFFFSFELSFSSIYILENLSVFAPSPDSAFSKVYICFSDFFVWFGKLKSNLALKIIQV